MSSCLSCVRYCIFKLWLSCPCTQSSAKCHSATRSMLTSSGTGVITVSQMTTSLSLKRLCILMFLCCSTSFSGNRVMSSFFKTGSSCFSILSEVTVLLETEPSPVRAGLALFLHGSSWISEYTVPFDGDIYIRVFFWNSPEIYHRQDWDQRVIQKY